MFQNLLCHADAMMMQILVQAKKSRYSMYVTAAGCFSYMHVLLNLSLKFAYAVLKQLPPSDKFIITDDTCRCKLCRNQQVNLIH